AKEGWEHCISTNNSLNTSFTSKISVSTTNIIGSSDFSATNYFSSLNNSQQQELMENQDRMFKELATPDVLELAQSYELKFGLIHLLPKFHGLAREDPHKHLKEFHVVCSTMRLQGILEDYIKMKTFLFSLDGAAKDWLYLQLVLFNTWGGFPDGHYPKRNMWNPAAYMRNIARILRTIQSLVCNLFTSSN
ncbi:hypothetical protein CR513_34976, partial [Mucuna pruriens]